MANYLAPDPIQSTYFIPGSNTPGSGVQIFMYAAGTTTKQTAYQDSTTTTPWSNPIVLDAGGNLPTGSKEVWLVGGQTYKAVYAPANDFDPPTSPYRTADNLSGVNDPSGISTNTEWIVGTTSTFISTTSFSVVGDQTALYTVGRRVKATVTAGTVYGTIVGSSFAASATTVTVRLDSGALDSGLANISYGLLQATNPSIPTTAMDQPTQTVTASSTTLNLVSTAARSIIISSTNPVSTMPIADGQVKFLEFSGALTLFHNSTSLALPGVANISTAAGDTAIARGEASGLTRILMYQRSATGRTPGKQPTRQVFTSSSGTYTTPSNTTRINVRLVGGGGGGSGRDANNGSTGGDTTFSTLTGSAGTGGTQGGSGGAGGAATGGDINIAGGGGPSAIVNSTGTVTAASANGGSSAFGGAGRGTNNATGGNAAANSGGGGAGAGGTSSTSSGAGGGAGGYVEKLITPPAATYSYGVGAGGAGGTAGGQAGGNGAAGIIIVDEYYD